MRGQGGEAERGRGNRDDMRGGQGKARGDGAKREGTRDDLALKRQQGQGWCVVPQTSRHKGRQHQTQTVRWWLGSNQGASIQRNWDGECELPPPNSGGSTMWVNDGMPQHIVGGYT